MARKARKHSDSGVYTPTAHLMNTSPTQSINIFKTKTNQEPVPWPSELPHGEHVSCLEYEDERSWSMSDDQVMQYLFEEFGISDGQ